MSLSFTINGRFLLQPITGVQRVAREALTIFDSMAADGRIAVPRLLLPANGEIVAPPDLRTIRPERVGRLSGHAWEQLDLPRHCGNEPLLCLGNTAPVGRLMSKNKPVVTMVHDLSYAYFPNAYSLKFRALYSAVMPVVLTQSDRVVTVSRAEMDAISRTYPKLNGDPRLSFLQNGGIRDVDAEVARHTPLPKRHERDYGIYVGSLTRRKNASGVIGGAIRFLRSFPEMRFVVIGATGASFEGVTYDIPADVAPRLEFWGQVNETSRIYRAFRGARFLLFPSFYEASPLPPIEAMTFGCPVISSDIASLTERCGDAAIYVKGDIPDAVDAAVSRLMTKDGLWESLSDAAVTQAAQYSWAQQAEGLVGLCKEVA